MGYFPKFFKQLSEAAPEVSYKKSYSKKFNNIDSKTAVPRFLFNKFVGFHPANRKSKNIRKQHHLSLAASSLLENIRG